MTVRLLTSTRTDNAFTFGVAAAMRNEYGDGFGLEDNSVGLVQHCAAGGGGDKLRLVSTSDRRVVRELDTRLEEGNTVSLRLADGEVTFWVNDELIDTVPAPVGSTIAGCTLHTSATIKMEPFLFAEPSAVVTEDGVRMARPVAPLMGTVASTVSDAGVGKVEILDGLCVFVSDESVVSGQVRGPAFALPFGLCAHTQTRAHSRTHAHTHAPTHARTHAHTHM
jgi:hypothetical protein